MALDKDLQQLFGDVRLFLHTVLPSIILPPPMEAERLRLLRRMQCFESSRPELQLVGHGDTVFSAGRDIEEDEEGLLQQKDSGTTEEIVSSEGRPGPPGMVHTQSGRVKRSSSLSSRSSSGSTSYTSNSYTSTSNTSNGYSSLEGGGGVASKPVQEDIYEEFDAVHMRIAAITPVSSPTSSTTDTSSTPTSACTTTTTPFFSSWRNSLTYGKREKRDSLHRESGKDGVTKDKSKDNIKQATAKNNKKNDKTNKKEKKSKNKKESSNAADSENKENLNEEETSECDVTDGSQIITESSIGDGLKDPDNIEGGYADLSENVSVEETSVGQDIEEHDDEEEVENSYMEGLQPVAFCSAVARCARHGVLHKKSKALLRSWRAFQAVVAPGVLLLYAKESDQRQRKGLELGLYDVRVATAEAESQPDRRDLVYFELVAPARKTHTFMTRTMSDRDEWIQAVGQYTRNRNSLPVLGAVATPSVSSSAVSSTPQMPASLRGSVATRLNAHLVPSPLTFAERAEGGAGEDDVHSTADSQEDTFSSDEVYEEVNMDDIRSAAGPSLSEMLESHMFPNNDLSTYYTVPDEDDTSSVTSLSTSTPKKQDGLTSSPTLAKGGKQPPARPPPPAFPIEKFTKNQSALHQKMVVSPKTALINAFKTPSKFSLPSSITAIKDRSPIACKKLGFSGSPSRPLPATPAKPAADDGEIYCEIDEEEDYYEESETDGVNLMTGTSQDSVGKKLYSVKDLPPPLPSRGPPPIPNLEQLISRNKPATVFDPDLFEDYDIPGDVDMQLLTHNIVNADHESDTLAPLPQDLSLVLPTYPMSPNSTPVKNPPIPEKGSCYKNDDSEEENVYKVPNSAPVNDDIYQVPPPNPVPVNNNNTISGLEKISSTPGFAGAPDLPNSSPPLKPRQSEIVQSPTVKRPPVTESNISGLEGDNNQSNNTLTSILSNGLVNRISPIKRDKSQVIEQNKNTLNSPSNTDGSPYKKTSFSTTISPTPSLGSISKSESVSGSNSLSVKARIALLNQNEVEVPSQGSPSKSSEDFVVMVDNMEIRLDQAKKRAFLESTLNLSEPGLGKVGPKTCMKRGDI